MKAKKSELFKKYMTGKSQIYVGWLKKNGQTFH